MDYHSLKPLRQDELASALVTHWTETLGANQVLQLLFSGDVEDLDVPPPLRPAMQDRIELSLLLAAKDPRVGIAFVASCRRRGGLAEATWKRLARYVCYPCTQSLWIERADLRNFVMKVTAALVQWNVPPNWVEDAATPPWSAQVGTSFHRDILRCSQIAAVPCVRSDVGASIQLYGEIGVAVMQRDKVLLFYILFFGSPNYIEKIPTDAPEILHTARQAPWLTSYRNAALSSNTTP